MNVLITGASGFVGSHLLKQLSKQKGYNVIGLVRRTSDLFRISRLRSSLVYGSLEEGLDEVTRGIDAVVHTAASTVYWGKSAQVLSTNVDGTLNLLNASLVNRVKRFIHFSSTVVYGFSGNINTDEDKPLRPLGTPYCSSKTIAEQKLLQFRNDIDLIILRPSNIYGPTDLLFTYLLTWAVEKGILRGFPRGGRTLTSPCYVKNIVSATIKALETEQGFGEAYNISDGSDMEWREFLGIIAEDLGKKPPRISLPVKPLLFIARTLESMNSFLGLKSRPLITPHDIAHVSCDYSFSIDKAARILGYKPQHTTQDGIEETVEWYLGYRKRR